MELTIRPARPDDAPALVEAERRWAALPGHLASRPEELDEAAFRAKIAALAGAPDGRYCVAESAGRVVGHALLEPMALASTRHIARLTIVVHAGHEGRGVGDRMLGELIAWARSAPALAKIELNVRAANARAIRLYARHGFALKARHRDRIRLPDGTLVDDLEMELFLRRSPDARSIFCESIGTVRSSRRDVVDDDWDQVEARIELDPRFSERALFGLDDFSHVEVLFLMDQVDPARIEASARHPRDRADWPEVGIFAQRAKNRPNRIGATICRVLGVEGRTVRLEGLDAVDGSPVLDLKPWVREFGPRGELRQPAWMSELMAGYWRKA